MNITCIICSDTIIPSSEIYATPCGHLFHHVCLIQWIERSKTCPQCRNKVTEKTVHRIYFNICNTDHIVDDVATLQNKIDNFQFQMTLKEKDVRNLTEKYRKAKVQNIALREEVSELENKTRVHDSVVHALKEQISFFKSKSKERDRLTEEVAKLKSKLKDVELVQTAIHGTREEVNDILRSNNEPESLVIMAATLKKALVDAEKKKLSVEHKFKQIQNDLAKYRRENASLQSSNEELRKEIELSKTHWGQEKEYLTSMVLDMHKSNSDKNAHIQRIRAESPVPISQDCLVNSKSSVTVKSPSVEEKVANILDSDSPYLPVKSSVINIDHQPSRTERCVQISSAKDISIFKKPTNKFGPTRPCTSTDIVYNGLGGHNKRELFASPKTPPLGIKRHRTGVSISSVKFRKLNSMSLLKK